MTAADVLLLAALADVVGLYGLADALRRGVAAGVPVRESWAAHTARAVARARPGWVRRPGPWWARKLLAVGAPAPPLARHERALL